MTLQHKPGTTWDDVYRRARQAAPEAFEANRIANLIGRENVMAATDCGFAQGPFYRRVHPSIMWAKLEAMAQGAKIASKQLWG